MIFQLSCKGLTQATKVESIGKLLKKMTMSGYSWVLFELDTKIADIFSKLLKSGQLTKEHAAACSTLLAELAGGITSKAYQGEA